MTEHEWGEVDEFGIVVPIDLGERAALTGYTEPQAFQQLNGSPDIHWPIANLADPEYAIPPDPPAIAGLLYEGKRHVLSGPQESAKTLVAYHLLLVTLRTGVPVAIVDLEMGPVATRRMLTDLGATTDELAAIHYTEPDGPPTPRDIQALNDHGARYVLIDAAAGAFDATGLDDNSRKDAETFARLWVQPLFKQGISTVLLDHVTKNAETRGKYAIGSERKTGGADVHLGFDALKTLTRGGSGLVKVTAHKDRGAYLNRPTAVMVELQSDPDTHAITVNYRPPEPVEAGPVKHTIYAERVSRALEKNDGQPMSQTQLEEAIQGGRDYIRAGAHELVQAGYATVDLGPRSAKIYTLTKPFRKDEYDPATPVSMPDEGSHKVPGKVRKLQENTHSDPATTPPPPRHGAVISDPATPPHSLQGVAGVDGEQDEPAETTTPPNEIDVWDPTIQHLLDDDIPW